MKKDRCFYCNASKRSLSKVTARSKRVGDVIIRTRFNACPTCYAFKQDINILRKEGRKRHATI